VVDNFLPRGQTSTERILPGKRGFLQRSSLFAPMTTPRKNMPSNSLRSAHCRLMRGWTLNGYMALIRPTSLTRSYVRLSLRGFAFSRLRGDWEGSKRSSQMAAQTRRAQRILAPLRHANRLGNCLIIGEDRKRSRHGQKDALDSQRKRHAAGPAERGPFNAICVRRLAN
jgi:hypothetical protein